MQVHVPHTACRDALRTRHGQGDLSRFCGRIEYLAYLSGRQYSREDIKIVHIKYIAAVVLLVASRTVVAQLKGTGAIHAGRLEAVQVIDTHQAAIEVKSRFFIHRVYRNGKVAPLILGIGHIKVLPAGRGRVADMKIIICRVVMPVAQYHTVSRGGVPVGIAEYHRVLAGGKADHVNPHTDAFPRAEIHIAEIQIVSGGKFSRLAAAAPRDKGGGSRNARDISPIGHQVVFKVDAGFHPSLELFRNTGDFRFICAYHTLYLRLGQHRAKQFQVVHIKFVVGIFVPAVFSLAVVAQLKAFGASHRFLKGKSGQVHAFEQIPVAVNQKLFGRRVGHKGYVLPASFCISRKLVQAAAARVSNIHAVTGGVLIGQQQAVRLAVAPAFVSKQGRVAAGIFCGFYPHAKGFAVFQPKLPQVQVIAVGKFHGLAGLALAKFHRADAGDRVAVAVLGIPVKIHAEFHQRSQILRRVRRKSGNGQQGQQQRTAQQQRGHFAFMRSHVMSPYAYGFPAGGGNLICIQCITFLFSPQATKIKSPCKI